MFKVKFNLIKLKFKKLKSFIFVFLYLYFLKDLIVFEFINDLMGCLIKELRKKKPFLIESSNLVRKGNSISLKLFFNYNNFKKLLYGVFLICFRYIGGLIGEFLDFYGKNKEILQKFFYFYKFLRFLYFLLRVILCLIILVCCFFELF